MFCQVSGGSSILKVPCKDPFSSSSLTLERGVICAAVSLSWFILEQIRAGKPLAGLAFEAVVDFTDVRNRQG